MVLLDTIYTQLLDTTEMEGENKAEKLCVNIEAQSVGCLEKPYWFREKA